MPGVRSEQFDAICILCKIKGTVNRPEMRLRTRSFPNDSESRQKAWTVPHVKGSASWHDCPQFKLLRVEVWLVSLRLDPLLCLPAPCFMLDGSEACLLSKFASATQSSHKPCCAEHFHWVDAV